MTTNYNKPISVRLDDETKDFYQKLADQDERKLAEYIRLLLIRLRKDGNVKVKPVD